MAEMTRRMAEAVGERPKCLAFSAFSVHFEKAILTNKGSVPAPRIFDHFWPDPKQTTDSAETFFAVLGLLFTIGSLISGKSPVPPARGTGLLQFRTRQLGTALSQLWPPRPSSECVLAG